MAVLETWNCNNATNKWDREMRTEKARKSDKKIMSWSIFQLNLVSKRGSVDKILKWNVFLSLQWRRLWSFCIDSSFYFFLSASRKNFFLLHIWDLYSHEDKNKKRKGKVIEFILCFIFTSNFMSFVLLYNPLYTLLTLIKDNKIIKRILGQVLESIQLIMCVLRYWS